MSRKLEGKVIIVTGGSTGIGRAAAMRCGADGAAVVIADVNVAAGEATAQEIERAGGRACFIRTDVVDGAAVKSLVDETVRRYGRLDGAFNNAGIEGDAYVPLADYPESTWQQVLDVNLTGVFLCMKHELPHIVAAQGAIVNMASVAGLVGGRMGAAYHASKHGVIGLTKAAAMEYAQQGVRINAVAPAVIHTPLAERAFFHDDKLAARVVSHHPMGRVGAPEEVAKAVVWLCSDEASFTTGHALPIDGGFVVP